MIPQKTFVTLSGSKDTVNSSAGLNAENKTIDIIRALDYHFHLLLVLQQLMSDSVLYLTDIWCSSGSGSRHRPRDS